MRRGRGEIEAEEVLQAGTRARGGRHSGRGSK